MRENSPSGPNQELYGKLDRNDMQVRLLVPLPGRPWGFVKHDDRDTILTCIAFGSHDQKPIHAHFYYQLKTSYLKQKKRLESQGKKNEIPAPQQYRLTNLARKYRCSVQKVRKAVHDLAKAGLIEIEGAPEQLSPFDGNLYRWVPDNWAERETDRYVRDVQNSLPESFRQVQDNLVASIEIVAEAAEAGTATEETAAKAAQMLVEIARLLRGEAEPLEPPGEDGSEPPKGPGSPHGHGHDAETTPHGHVRPEAAVDDDEAVPPPPPGYAELAALDKRADRHKKSYQATAKKAYRKLLADNELIPEPEEIAAAYRVYTEGLEKDGKEKMRRSLAKWLTADDEYGAREGVRRIRKTAASAAKVPRKPTWPETVSCPRCGERARHLDGPVYQCSNLDCDFRDPFTISRHLIE